MLKRALIVLALLCLCGCSRRKVDFGTNLPFGGGPNDPEAAKQASEHIPPETLRGKTCNDGRVIVPTPIMDWIHGL